MTRPDSPDTVSSHPFTFKPEGRVGRDSWLTFDVADWEEWHMPARWLAILFLVITALGPLTTGAAQAQNCQFVLGFATLHNLIPQIVGNCLENEHHNAV